MHSFGLCLALLVSCVWGAPAGDEITSLPGYKDKLPSKMYSGLLDSSADGKMHTHYWFVESENDPKNDPVVVWYNGGPGASSMFGFLVEMGPFQLSENSLLTDDYNKTGIPTLFYNPYSWSKVANYMAVNAPPPVGYSYCDPKGPSGDGYSCGDWDDTKTANVNKNFLENWVKAFPEFATNDMYITGESYAGVYVPSLAQTIQADKNTKINLKGFAVGDGCLGNQDWKYHGSWFSIEFMHGHGQFSDKLYWEIMGTCTTHELLYGRESNACRASLHKMGKEEGGYFAYSLYDECTYQHIFAQAPGANGRMYDWWDMSPDAMIARNLQGALNDYPCGGGMAMNVYVNRTEVMKALHVSTDSIFFNQDNAHGFNYKSNIDHLLPYYKSVITSTQSNHLRVLVYNGDTDPGLNSFRAENWTAGIGIQVKESWRPWTVDGKQKMGGYVTRYHGDFDFVTIRGAGHMVPQFKPAASLEMITRWLRNQEYPHYK